MPHDRRHQLPPVSSGRGSVASVEGGTSARATRTAAHGRCDPQFQPRGFPSVVCSDSAGSSRRLSAGSSEDDECGPQPELQRLGLFRTTSTLDKEFECIFGACAESGREEVRLAAPTEEVWASSLDSTGAPWHAFDGPDHVAKQEEETEPDESQHRGCSVVNAFLNGTCDLDKRDEEVKQVVAKIQKRRTKVICGTSRLDTSEPPQSGQPAPPSIGRVMSRVQDKLDRARRMSCTVAQMNSKDAEGDDSN